MVLIAIGILITLYGFVNFRKGFKLFLIYQIFWLSSAQLFTLGSFSVTLALLMTSVYWILFFCKNVYFYKRKPKMPYTTPFLYIFFSLFVTCFTGVTGFVSEFTRAISTFLISYSTIFIAWYVINSEKDFYYVIKGYIIVFCVAVVFGYIEYLLQSNFLIAYKGALTASGRINTYTLAHGRGYRIISLFEHSIGAGMTFGLFSAFVLYLVYNQGKRMPYRRLTITVALLAIPLVVLTKMRSGILFTTILILGLVHYNNIKKKRTYKLLFICILAVVAAFPLLQDNFDLFRSFFSSEAQKKVGGSDATMRFAQLEAVLNIMKMSPIGGLGSKFSTVISNSYTKAALSYESLWFEQMTMHGLVGVVAHIILVFYSVVVIPVKYKSRECFFISLAYFATYTFSSTPSFRVEMYYFCLFWFIKNSPKFKSISQKTEGYINAQKTI